MIHERPVNITIKDKALGGYVQIPVLPSSIEINSGDAIDTITTVLGIGSVGTRVGTDLATINWSSFFPRRYDPSYCQLKELKTPEGYALIFNTWKDKGTIVQVIIPSARINIPMKVTAIPNKIEGFEGDLTYSITLLEHRTVKPVKISTLDSVLLAGVDVVKADRAKVNRYETRAPAPPKTTVGKLKEFVVKTRETLVTIAKKTFTPWAELYDTRLKSTVEAIKDNPAVIAIGEVFKLVTTGR